MSTFNTSTGSVTRVSSAGSDTWTPPFTSSTQVDSYITALEGIITAGGNIKGLNTVDLSTAATSLSAGKVNSQIISTSPKLPAVHIWKLPNNNFVVVYVDASGNSSFSYKNDPNNYVQLMANGSQIIGSPSPAANTPPSTSSGTPSWVFMIFACVCLLFIGGGIMFAMKK